MVLDRERVVVTGGGGYVGFRLGRFLADIGYSVLLLDVCQPEASLPPGVSFLSCDVRNADRLRHCFTDADLVFHIASYGMSGRQQLQHRLTYEVNILGTRNVISACIARQVPRLVYTSTYNTLFGGQPIEGGDETLPHFPPHLHPDTYSRTKALAEQEVLAANGAPLIPAPGAPRLREGASQLHTCVIRPAGIYGPGEQRHLPRVVAALEAGLFKFVYGSPSVLVDFVHVDNLVQAHWLAAEGLRQGNQLVAAGQSYCISDDAPINNFEFFRPLAEGLGYPMPTLRLPLWLVYWGAAVLEVLHILLRPFYDFQPLLTRAEVLKTGVTHYFSMAKARRELGYEPQRYPFHPVVHWFEVRGHGKRKRSQGIQPLSSLVSWAVAAAAVTAVLALSYALAVPLPPT